IRFEPFRESAGCLQCSALCPTKHGYAQRPSESVPRIGILESRRKLAEGHGDYGAVPYAAFARFLQHLQSSELRDTDFELSVVVVVRGDRIDAHSSEPKQLCSLD